MESFTMEIVDGGNYVKALLAAERCPICKKIMIQKETRNSVFPQYYKLSQESQMLGSNIVFKSSGMQDDKHVCIECLENSRITFTCSLCDKQMPSIKIQESIGYPADFLCINCYESVPAKIWLDKVSELEEHHKYDFE